MLIFIEKGLLINWFKMDEVGNVPSNSESDPQLNTDSIPKMNVKFDGYTWTNQANQAATYSVAKSTTNSSESGLHYAALMF